MDILLTDAQMKAIAQSATFCGSRKQKQWVNNMPTSIRFKVKLLLTTAFRTKKTDFLKAENKEAGGGSRLLHSYMKEVCLLV